MDLATIGTAAASAPAGVLIYKLAEKVVEKFPWGRIFSRNGNGKKLTAADQDRVKVLIADHEKLCSNAIRKDIKELGETLFEKHDVLQATITQILLRNGG
jgi:hypothetical protein